MKSYEIKFEGSKLLFQLDPNQDGEPVIKLELELAEIPDEVLSAIQSKKAEKSN